MNRKKSRPKRASFPFFLFPILCFLGGLGLAYGYKAWFFPHEPFPLYSPLANTAPRSTPTPTPIPDPRAISLLLLGYGGEDHEGGYLTDTIMQVVVRPEEKKILLLSIPRDTAVDIPISATGIESEKLNAAFAIGLDDRKYPNKPPQYKGTTNPGALPKKLVGDITGIPISHFVAVSFDGFVKAIDVLGGVDVTFPYAFEDPRYPVKGKEDDTCEKSEEEIASFSAVLTGDKLEEQFMCRFETLKVDKGKQHLDGQTALKVARSRHSPLGGGDFSRVERQRLIVQAVKERVFEIGFLAKAIPFFWSLGSNMKTVVDAGLLATLLPFASEIRSYKIISIALTTDNVLIEGYNAKGQYVLHPSRGIGQWGEIQEFIQKEATKSAGR